MGHAPGRAENCIADLNRLYRREPALHEVDFDYTGFEWIDCHNYDDSMLVVHPQGQESRRLHVSFVCNFTPVVRQNYRLGVPEGGWYQEVFNCDSTYYGGSNVGNYPGVMASNDGTACVHFQSP